MRLAEWGGESAFPVSWSEMGEQPQDPRRAFAKRVEGLKAERGLSDEVLASRARLQPSELRAVLEGSDRVPLDVIFLLAGALKVQPGELLEGLNWVPDGEGGGEYHSEDPEGR